MLTQLFPLLITILSAMSSIISRYSSVHGQKFRSSTVTSTTRIHPKKVFPVYQNGKNKIISVTQTKAESLTNENAEVVLSASQALAGTAGRNYDVSSPALMPVLTPAQRPAKPASKPEPKPVIQPTRPVGNIPARKPNESSEITTVFKPTVPANAKPFLRPAQNPAGNIPARKPAESSQNTSVFQPAQTPANAKPLIKPAQTPANAKPFLRPAQKPANAKPFLRPAQKPGSESGNNNFAKMPAQIPTTAAPVRKVDQSNGIQYHGGPVMMGTVNIYFIWHGNWGDNTARNILEFFAANIGGSSWYDIQTTYTDGSGVPISNSVLFKQSANSTYVAADPNVLSGADITSIFTKTLDSKAVPVDDNGVYFILTSPDLQPDGFASRYCGWHSFIDYNGVILKFALIGNAININPWGCIGDPDHSPNGNPGADGMADVIAHELVEAVTDPLLNSGWFGDSDNYENADRCAWNYGDVMTEDSNGGYYNIVLGNSTGSQKKFLIQKNWLNSNGGYCALKRP